MRRVTLLALLAGSALSASSIARQPASTPATPTPPATPTVVPEPAAAPSADQIVPIRKITLYRSGVGYFERSGQVVGTANLQLRFKTEQVNDILKSMVLLDLSGGRIDSVSYGSKEPLQKRLASFGINIAANPSVPELLAQLRGAPIRVQVGGEAVSGTILGVESRQTAATKDSEPIIIPFVNLVTDTGIRSISVQDVTSFELLDKELAGELGKALAALAEYRADRTKTVDLRFAGEGARRVVVGYVHEMPVWKTSYRLVLPEPPTSAKASEGASKYMLQGWAIVENTTDQDWNNVQLGLVSGRPVSFQMDLYEPLFSARPWIPVPTIPGVAPRIFALGVDAEQMAEGAAMGRSMDGMAANMAQAGIELRFRGAGRPMAPAAAPVPPVGTRGVPGGDGDPGSPAYAGVSAADMADYSGRAAASGLSVGEVFQFQVDAPVSIERQKSAMIPIMSGMISGRRVSIFNPSDGSQYPMRGVELTNDSGQPLLPGPISVFDGAAYAGDAQIGQIPKGDKRFLAYAMDLDVAVLTNRDSVTATTRAVIRNGSIVLSVRDRISSTYEIANKDAARPRTLIIEQPKSQGYELVDTDKPSETTQDLYRFTLDLDASKARRFTVQQERTRAETFAVTGYSSDLLASFHKDGKASAAVVKAFAEAAAKQAAITDTERQIAEIARKTDEIARDQDRIRSNMGAVDRNSQLYSSYVARLTRQETDLDQLREQRTTLQTQLERQRKDLADFLATLNAD